MRSKLYFVFIVFIILFFCFGSVQAETAVDIYQTQALEVTDGIDNFFTNNQDTFDYYMTQKNRNGYIMISESLKTISNNYFNYYVEPRQFSQEELPNVTNANLRYGYIIYAYRTTMPLNYNLTQYSVVRGSIPGYTDYGSLSYTAVKLKAQYTYFVYNYGFDEIQYSSTATDFYCPTSVLYYSHSVFWDYIASTNSDTTSLVTGAISSQTTSLNNNSNNNTTTITNSINSNFSDLNDNMDSNFADTQSVISTSAQESTDRILSTETTDPTSIGVDNNTVDNTADLTSIFNKIKTAFTTYDTTVRTFTLKLPNGSSHRFQLLGNILENKLDLLGIKAFYQAFYYLVFGGFVIFDFKKIYNKFKNGDFEGAINSSSIDNVVNKSLM